MNAGIILYEGAAFLCALVFFHHAMRNARAWRAGSTPIPLVGGCAGALACLVVPWEPLHAFWWVPPLLDVGTAAHQCAALRTLSRASAAAVDDPDDPRERAGAGSLLGLAVGDALGLPYEGLSRRRQRRWFAAVDRHRLLGGRGLCSDDTEHAWMTAQALLACGGDPQRFAAMLAFKLRWWLLGLPAGIGYATLRACVRLWCGLPPARAGVRSAGNGAAMRAAIIGTCVGHDPVMLRAMLAASTRLTHRDADAEHGALAVAWAAHLAAGGDDGDLPRRFLDLVERELDVDSPMRRALTAAIDSIGRGESTEDWADAIGCGNGVSGYVLHTVPVVVHAWLASPSDYRCAVTTIIRLGGDTDSTAAILGGIVGARVGAQGIPSPWIDRMIEWPRTSRQIRRLGARAARAAATRTRSRELPVLVPALVLRNAVFMLIVLAHGMRRLLPPYR